MIRKLALSFLAVVSMLACEPPCQPGDVSVTGQRYFSMFGTPTSVVTVSIGSCPATGITIRPGTSGAVRAGVDPSLRLSPFSVSTGVSIPNAPVGDSEVSILVNGVNRWFGIRRTEASWAAEVLEIGFANCAPFFNSAGRTFCNGIPERLRDVVGPPLVFEIVGAAEVQRWPGQLFESESNLYRVDGARVSVFNGGVDGASMSFETDVVGVAGTPETLFVVVGTSLHVASLSKAKILTTLQLGDGRAVKTVRSRASRVALTLHQYLPNSNWLHRYSYSVTDGLVSLSEPRRLAPESGRYFGMNSRGLAWECDADTLRFIDAFDPMDEGSWVDALPGLCAEADDNPVLWAGYDGTAAGFCPVWNESGSVRFVGVMGFNPAVGRSSRCYENYIVSFGGDSTSAVDLRTVGK